MVALRKEGDDRLEERFKEQNEPNDDSADNLVTTEWIEQRLQESVDRLWHDTLSQLNYERAEMDHRHEFLMREKIGREEWRGPCHEFGSSPSTHLNLSHSCNGSRKSAATKQTRESVPSDSRSDGQNGDQ